MISIKKKMFYYSFKLKLSTKNEPEQKWITTYNDYLHSIKHFYRWLWNRNGKSVGNLNGFAEYSSFLESLKPEKTKISGPYSKTEIWKK
jgi:integrase/recombinase XerD